MKISRALYEEMGVGGDVLERREHVPLLAVYLHAAPIYLGGNRLDEVPAPVGAADPGGDPRAEAAGLRPGLDHRGAADLLDGRPHAWRNGLEGNADSCGGRDGH